MPLFPLVPEPEISLEVSPWLCLVSSFWALLFFCLCLSLCLSVSVSGSFCDSFFASIFFWVCLLVFFSLPFLFLYVCLFMSLGFSRILSLPLSHSATLSNSVSCYVSLSFSDSLWLSLCLCLSDHLPVLGLVLSPSLPLPFILSVPPCSFVVVPGYLEKFEWLSPRSREIEKQYCHTEQLWLRTMNIPWNLFLCLGPKLLKCLGHIISVPAS